MELRFYGAAASSEIIPPQRPHLDDVHEAYVTMAASGILTKAQKSVFAAAALRLVQEQHVRAIMLGGTDLALAFDERTSDFPLVDCAGIHVNALVRVEA